MESAVCRRESGRIFVPHTDGIKREALQNVAGISKRFQNDFPLQIDLSLKIWRILRDNMIAKG